MHATDAIRIIALRDVWLRHIEKADDADYNRRKIFRWYSINFNTPLHIVETLPMLDVIRAYWEQNYEGMSEEDLAAAVAAGAYGNLATAPSSAPVGPKGPPGRGKPREALREAEIAPKIDIKDLEKLPQSISIKFTDDDEDPDFDQESDGLGLLEIPAPRAAKPKKP